MVIFTTLIFGLLGISIIALIIHLSKVFFENKVSEAYMNVTKLKESFDAFDPYSEPQMELPVKKLENPEYLTAAEYLANKYRNGIPYPFSYMSDFEKFSFLTGSNAEEYIDRAKINETDLKVIDLKELSKPEQIYPGEMVNDPEPSGSITEKILEKSLNSKSKVPEKKVITYPQVPLSVSASASTAYYGNEKNDTNLVSSCSSLQKLKQELDDLKKKQQILERKIYTATSTNANSSSALTTVP